MEDSLAKALLAYDAHVAKAIAEALVEAGVDAAHDGRKVSGTHDGKELSLKVSVVAPQQDPVAPLSTRVAGSLAEPFDAANIISRDERTYSNDFYESASVDTIASIVTKWVLK